MGVGVKKLYHRVKNSQEITPPFKGWGYLNTKYFKP